MSKTKLFHATKAGMLAASLLVYGGFQGPAIAQSITGTIMDANGSTIGSVTIRQTASNILHLQAGLDFIPQGPHGFHIHETGQCDPSDGFKSAGGHYAGTSSHGVTDASGPHPGDFPNIHAPADGPLVIEYFTDRLSITGGVNPILDDDGSALVIHSRGDDYTSQPSGDAGDRIACAVLERDD